MELDINLQNELISAISALNVNKSWLENPAIIALISGFMAIMGAVISNIYNLKSEDKRNKAEVIKINIEFEIRKKEKIYDYQLEALIELSLINHDLTPTAWPYREYDSYESNKEIVSDMPDLIEKLDLFLKKYSYILPAPILENINNIIFICNENHWNASNSETPIYNPTDKEIEAAEVVIKELHESIKNFKEILGAGYKTLKTLAY